MENILIKKADWVSDNTKLKYLRRKVFIEEQGVAEELEWDTMDETAFHCLAYIDDKPVGTARLQFDGQIGRMAVLKKYRNKGIGKKLLKYLINYHQSQSKTAITIHAQSQAIEFYKKIGFIKKGDEFMEAGIPHFIMSLNYSQP